MDGLVMKYFVLNPNKKDHYGKASREAIETYASVIAATNPILATDLLNWIKSIKEHEKTN